MDAPNQWFATPEGLPIYPVVIDSVRHFAVARWQEGQVTLCGAIIGETPYGEVSTTCVACSGKADQIRDHTPPPQPAPCNPMQQIDALQEFTQGLTDLATNYSSVAPNAITPEGVLATLDAMIMETGDPTGTLATLKAKLMEGK